MKYILLTVILIIIKINLISLSNVKLDGFIKKPYKIYNFTNIIEEFDDQTLFDKNCPSINTEENKKLSGCKCKLNTIVCMNANLLQKFPIFKFPNGNIIKTNWSLNLKCKNFTILNNIYQNVYALKSIHLIDLSFDNEDDSVCQSSNKHRLRLHKIDFRNFTEICNKNDSIRIEELILRNNNINEAYFNLSNMIIENIHLEFNNLTKILKKEVDFDQLQTKFINISFNNIKDFDESILYSKLKSIDISHNKLKSFIKMNEKNNAISKLIHLNLSQNSFYKIPFNRETTLTSLQTLNLSSNYINEIDKFNFINFPKLKYLYLEKNLISIIHENSFQHLTNLEVLDLSSNLIKNLTSTFLFESQIFNLKFLNINFNLIETLSLNTLKYLQNCKYLHLSNNKLTTITNYTFGYMKSLIEIDLAFNSIQNIDAEAFNIHKYSYLGPGLLEKIDLSTNYIETLPTNLFQYLINLRYLLLNKNMIKTLDTKLFEKVNSLIHLDLSLNSISNLSFLLNENFKNLKYLKLSNNLIKSIPNRQFKYLRSLRYLDLSSNKINKINDCSFYDLKDSIRKLILNYNFISTINACAFTHGFKQIRFLHLLFNPINCTANCNFFHILFNEPYALSYLGDECLVNNLDFSMLSCSFGEYENISSTCEKREHCDKIEFYTDDVDNNSFDVIAAEELLSNENKIKNEVKSIDENETIQKDFTISISNQNSLHNFLLTFSIFYLIIS